MTAACSAFSSARMVSILISGLLLTVRSAREEAYSRPTSSDSWLAQLRTSADIFMWEATAGGGERTKFGSGALADAHHIGHAASQQQPPATLRASRRAYPHPKRRNGTKKEASPPVIDPRGVTVDRDTKKKGTLPAVAQASNCVSRSLSSVKRRRRRPRRCRRRCRFSTEWKAGGRTVANSRFTRIICCVARLSFFSSPHRTVGSNKSISPV